MNGTRSILDRIKNLTSDESKVLQDFNNRINKANESKNKAEEEKKAYEKEITDVQNDIDDISKASEISDRFANLEEYMPGLKKLGKTVELLDNLKAELNKIPEEIEKKENKIKELTDESDNRSKVIKEEEDELSKLDVEISDAKRYQENLIELIDLAKSGDINKTREEVVETLMHVGFTDKEAISAAKVILFPEDDLIPYFNRDVDKKVEVKEETVDKEIEKSQPELENDTPTIEENTVTAPVETQADEIELDSVEASEISLEEIDDETKLNPIDVATDSDLDYIKSLLIENGFEVDKFNEEDLDTSKEQVEENIKFLNNKEIKKEFVYEYPNIISDSKLIDKYNFIINTLEKTPEDIKLTPEILASYSLEDLEKLTQVSTQTGINPKSISLPIYIKGLQSFFRNYLLLKDNNIILDDNELSKFAVILSINPVDFKKSLQIMLDYHLTLRKSDGKIAIMNLAIKDVELAKKMDMIIGAGEEDLLKYYPEVLSTDVKELVNRLLFLKKSEIPYKTASHNKVVYQSFVLRQDVLDKVLERHVELNEVIDRAESNNDAKEILADEDLIDDLDKIEEDFEMLSNAYLEDYKEVIKVMKNKYRETENSYVISGICFSKNKVHRNISYLLSTYGNANKETILLASLLHDSRLSKEDMESVKKALNI